MIKMLGNRQRKACSQVLSRIVASAESGKSSEENCEDDGRDYPKELPGEALASDKMLQEEVRKL